MKKSRHILWATSQKSSVTFVEARRPVIVLAQFVVRLLIFSAARMDKGRRKLQPFSSLLQGDRGPKGTKVRRGLVPVLFVRAVLVPSGNCLRLESVR